MVEVQKQNPLNFLLCIDRNFVLGAGALIASLLVNHPKRQCQFYIFTSAQAQAEIKDKLSRLQRNFPRIAEQLHYLSYDAIPLFGKLQGKVNSRILVQCMRIIAVRACPIVGRNLIYLDADIVCLGDLSELADTDFGEKAVAVMSDCKHPIEITTDSGHMFTVDHYFVSGVMVFNQSAWNASSLDEQCINFVAAEHPVFPDQDALNVVCAEHCAYLDDKYQRSPASFEPDGVILHYAGGKPWTPWHFHEYPMAVNVFRRYCKLFEPDVTKWITFKAQKDTLLNFNSFHARRAAKWLSKLFFKRGRYLAGFYFYWRHLQIKLQQKGVIGILMMRSNTRS